MSRIVNGRVYVRDEKGAEERKQDGVKAEMKKLVGWKDGTTVLC